MNSFLINGNALKIPLADKSVQCCITSPPYWGLRDYQVANQLGMEPSHEEYVENMVTVFREVWRVLKDDGVVFLNLGDSYSVGSNFGNFLERIIKGGRLFFRGRCALTITSKSKDILGSNNVSPDSKLIRLLGMKRITIKQRHNDFCQVVDFLNSESGVWISPSVPFVIVDDTNSEIILDKGDGISIIISQGDLDTDPAFWVSVGSLSAVYSDMAFPIKKTAKPITEAIGDIQTNRDAVSLNPSSKGILNVNAINQTVSLANAFVPDIQDIGDFSIAKASREKLALLLMDGAIEFTIGSVGHLFVSNSFGSLMRYGELYDKAERLSNATQAKQEMGIPDLVKRRLMEDGWICRSTIIWHKPNPMPESVRDRPTKSHEYIFLLTKNARYFYDADAIREHVSDVSLKRSEYGWDCDRPSTKNASIGGEGIHTEKMGARFVNPLGRNKRSVWTVTTKPYSGAHFATFPPDLIEPCIKAGSAAGDIVLDPFIGSGTTCMVARNLGRVGVGLDLSMDYLYLARKRLELDMLESWKNGGIEAESNWKDTPLFSWNK